MKNVILLIIALLLIGTGVYVYRKNHPIITEVQSTPTPTETTSVKTYTNTEFGFQFDYPSYAKIEPENGGGFIAARLSLIASTGKETSELDKVTIRVYTKKDTPDIYGAMREGESEFTKIVKNLAFLIQIDGSDKSDQFLLNTIESSIKFATYPETIGECFNLTVLNVLTRLGIPDSGSAITYTNGAVQVSNVTIKGIDDSKPGDKVNLCLFSIPTDCPPGDERGKIYGATNLRTGESWGVSNSSHGCGGA
ncbi:MAG: PsbP-related protein [Candidatus Pacebacteria bacterium]|nr:PsbP-related protein [Candidatus Paceibacterota bacterium]MDD5357160.1 PsbP-related protein [Candidatus Paceibacterota bacterium]